MQYLQELTRKLQDQLQELLGIDIPIIEVADNANRPALTAPTIIATGYNFGDSYGGSSSRTEYLTFELARVPKRFKLEYTITVCESAGQCDEDTLRLEGASAEEIAMLKPLFFPNGNYGNDIKGPRLYVDGVEQVL